MTEQSTGDVQGIQPLDEDFMDHLFEGVSEELPDDPWALLEGSEFEDSDQDKVISALEKDEDINDFLPNPVVQHIQMHVRDKDVEELFDDELEQQLAILIKVRVHEVCHINTPWTEREKAIGWVFCSTDDTQEDNDFLSLLDAVSPFQARTEILQVRIQHQLYRQSIPLRTPLPWSADEPPTIIEGELATTIGGDNAITLMRIAWMWPGMRLDLLKEQAAELWNDSEYDVNVVMDDMIDSGYLGISNGFVYGICRNPELREKGGTFSWSDAL